LTTRGDLLTLDSSADPARIGIGTNGYVLTSDGTDAAWAELPASGVAGDSDQLVMGSQVFG
jgi:hypothetical protein